MQPLTDAVMKVLQSGDDDAEDFGALDAQLPALLGQVAHAPTLANAAAVRLFALALNLARSFATHLCSPNRPVQFGSSECSRSAPRR